MTGIEKAAILFRVLGSENTAPLYKSMRPDEVKRVGSAMVRLERNPPTAPQIESVLSEFKGLMESGGGIFANVNETLEEMFSAAFKDQGPAVLDEVRVEAQLDSPLKELSGIPHSDLERVLREEHPQIQAMILANVDSDVAAGILSYFPDEDRAEMVERIAVTKPPSPRLLNDLADIFLAKTEGLPRFDAADASASDANLKRVADILNAAAGADNSGLLDQIGSRQPDLVEQIRETMFTFDDIENIDKMTMQKVLGNIDTKLLALSLKACTDEVASSIFAAVSQRTRDMVAEERELLGAVPIAEVREAQGEIMTIIRGMMESGAIQVSVGAGDAELVE